MDVMEIRNMDDDALLDELDDRKEELQRLRFQKEIGQLEDTNLIRYAKRDIARIKTVMRERQLAVEQAAQEEGSN